MRTYICKIESNSSYTREYEVETSSAINAAKKLGRCEDGEAIQITNKSGRVISEARWTSEDGGKYYRCNI